MRIKLSLEEKVHQPEIPKNIADKLIQLRCPTYVCINVHIIIGKFLRNTGNTEPYQLWAYQKRLECWENWIWVQHFYLRRKRPFQQDFPWDINDQTMCFIISWQQPTWWFSSVKYFGPLSTALFRPEYFWAEYFSANISLQNIFWQNTSGRNISQHMIFWQNISQRNISQHMICWPNIFLSRILLTFIFVQSKRKTNRKLGGCSNFSSFYGHSTINQKV